MPVSNPTETIDPRILRLIGLEDVFDLDYETYLTLLKEVMVKSRMTKTAIPTEEIELVTNEYKRVKNKRDSGRFQVKKKKITAASFSFGGKKLPGAKGTKALPGAGISSSPLSKGFEENIAVITSSVVSIAEIMRQQAKLTDDAAAFERKKAEREKRSVSESKLEKRFDGLKKAAEKIIAPVKGVLDRIFNFLTTVFFGRILYKIVEWFGDPKNASKVKSVIRFVKDWWPALLSSYILFGTSFGKLLRFTLGWVGRFAFQVGKIAIPALLRLIGRNPVASLAIAGGIGAYAASQQNEQKREGVKPGQGAPGASQLQREQTLQRGLGGMFAGGGLARRFFHSASGGKVAGQKGVDKVPAMLTDGEFVMSRGAVQRYGVDTLEAMNAAGGGTNRPRMMQGLAYAQGGGLMGENPDPNYKDPVQDRRLELMKSLERYAKSQTSMGGDINLIRALSNLTSVLRGGGGSVPSSGGGITGFARRLPGEIGKKIFGGTSVSGGGGSGGFLSAQNYLSRVRREVGKKLSSLRAPDVNIGKMTSDIGGIFETIKGAVGAAEEAIPALGGGLLGMNRTDTNISEDMQRALLSARKTAGERGRDYVDYKDYDPGAGGMAAALTMGRIGNKEWKRDSKGRIIGLRQVYDTNRSAEVAMKQAGDSFKDFFKTGNPKSLMRAIYKPGEALLAKVQDRGVTTHDVNFSEKVLGFKSEAIKNQEALEKKRPWWDKMGMFGGASRSIQDQARNAGASGQYGRYAAPSQQAKFSRPAGTGPKPVKPPSKPPVQVVRTKANTVGGGGMGGGRGSRGSSVPNIPMPKPSRTKADVIGVRK